MEGGIAIHLAPSALGHIGALPVTNTLLTAIVVSLLLIVFAFFAGRALKMSPGKGQTVLELLVTYPYDFVRETLGNDKVAMRIYPIVMTIFLLTLSMNWFGLLPFVGAIGTEVESTGHAVEAPAESEGHAAEEYASAHEPAPEIAHAAEPEHHFVPFFYPGATDLNFTLMLAIVAFFTIEVLGIATLGVAKYAGKFFVNPIRNPLGAAIGVIELVTEFARLISFSFRLFGNIFAGKVLILVAMFFAPLFLPIPILAFELVVGLIQAAIFALLTLFFTKSAIALHDDHEAHHSEVGEHAPKAA